MQPCRAKGLSDYVIVMCVKGFEWILNDPQSQVLLMQRVETSGFDDLILKARLGRLISLWAPEERFTMFWVEDCIQHK